jgi:hypothetical protein
VNERASCSALRTRYANEDSLRNDSVSLPIDSSLDGLFSDNSVSAVRSSELSVPAQLCWNSRKNEIHAHFHRRTGNLDQFVSVR